MKQNNLLDADERLKRKNEFDANLVFGSKKFHYDTKRDEIIKEPTLELLTVVSRRLSGIYKRKDKYFINLDKCPLCSSGNHSFFIERMGISIHLCRTCEFGFQNPKLKKYILDDLYKKEKTASSYYLSDAQILIDIKRYDYGLELLEAYLPPSKNFIVDIGCGRALSLERAILRGWNRCLGIEPNRQYDFPSDSRIQISNTSYEKALPHLEIKADAIMMWDVLEHVYEPWTFLKDIKNKMNEKALFLIMVPNLKSLASRLIRDNSPTFNWSHLNYFTVSSLRKLLVESGFTIELIETVISEIGNINNYLAFDDPYCGDNEKTATLEFLTPEFIHNHLLGSRLLLIARK